MSPGKLSRPGGRRNSSDSSRYALACDAKVVEHHQCVASLAHEILAHGHRGIRCRELQARRRIARGHHDDRILHRTVQRQIRDNVRDGKFRWPIAQ